MTTVLEIYNQALAAISTRSTVASLTENSVEANNCNLLYPNVRDDLLRMAPWDCATNYVNLNLITAAAGTPENPNTGAAMWAKGVPPPPWAYEYQYPVDCLRALWVVPQFSTGFASGVPITTAVTGGSPQFWTGPPVRYKVAIDQFYPVTAAAVNAGGLNYVVGDLITLALTPSGANPIGAPAQLRVASVGVSGTVASVTLVNVINGGSPAVAGSYFLPQTNPVAQSSTTGVGTGATFNLSYGSQGNQRVILTNQENAILAYCSQVTDPNIWDSLFQSAIIDNLAAALAMSLSGDKALANVKLGMANETITRARTADGNEGLTINDVTPDWIRARGILYENWEGFPNQMFDWGPLLSAY